MDIVFDPYERLSEHKVYRFSNGFGLSVIRNQHSYGGSRGLWEVAVIKFIADDSDDYHLTYDTELLDDVAGHLTWREVQDFLKVCSQLDSNGKLSLP